MRSEIVFYLNGRRISAAGPEVFEPLSTFLRYQVGLTGTKIVCEEGDCGACTVLLGQPRDGKLAYHSINSCIYSLFQVDGSHVITVEGLKREGELHPVQSAMLACHGAQCGFCTPGFVMAMAGLCEEKQKVQSQLSAQDLRVGLTGNLCRCTGYEPILKAGQSLSLAQIPALSQLYPETSLLPDLTALGREAVRIQVGDQEFERPADLKAAVGLVAAGATIFNGATDLGVQVNKGRRTLQRVLTLQHLNEMQDIRMEPGLLDVGAAASWTRIEEAVRQSQPEFAAILAVFASPQIKNAGGMAGNIINGSPIADSLPYLMVAGADLVLFGPEGERTLPITQLYRGYKDLALQPGEILTRIRIPLLKEGHLKLYKVSKRKDLDISSFTAAIFVKVQNRTIAEARISLGGVAAVVQRQTNVEEFLVGRAASEETFRSAGQLAARSIEPLSDVRGSRHYRLRLTENAFLRFFRECEQDFA